MDNTTNLEAIFKHDRWIVLAGLAGVTAIAWAYLAALAGDMNAMAPRKTLEDCSGQDQLCAPAGEVCEYDDFFDEDRCQVPRSTGAPCVENKDWIHPVSKLLVLP